MAGLLSIERFFDWLEIAGKYAHYLYLCEEDEQAGF